LLPSAANVAAAPAAVVEFFKMLRRDTDALAGAVSFPLPACMSCFLSCALVEWRHG
jgi:hypothetical protein